MKKGLTITLIILITAVAVYVVTLYFKMYSFSFAWILNFVLMMSALTFTETLNGKLSASYFNEKKWERRGQVYEPFGVNYFRKLLVIIGWEKLNKKSAPVKKATEVLTKLHYQTKKAELGHLIILVIVAVFNIYVAIKYGLLKAVWLLVLNILLNLYPIFVQRYNRPRIQRMILLNKRR